MARINIEDRLFTDPRFTILSKRIGAELALGKLVLAWRCAQDYHLKGEGIPSEIFEMMEFAPLVDAKFAVLEGDSYYLRGSKESFGWLEKKKESGKRGGEAKAESARKILANPSTRVAKASTELANASESYPLTLTPTLTPSLINKKERETLADEITPDIVIHLFNKIIAGKGRVHFFGFFSLARPVLEEFIITSGFPEFRTISQWENYFNVVASRKKLLDYPVTISFLVKHANAVEILSGGYQDRVEYEKPQIKPITEARDMSAKIWSDVLQNGMHKLKETIQTFSKVELRALDIFGRASEIINCPSDFEATGLKKRLRESCEQAISEMRSAEAC